MRKKQQPDEGGGANWMDTYGDLVTLLLCFFVLLYSFSSVDAEKWQQVVMSFRGSGASVFENGSSVGPVSPNDIFNPINTLQTSEKTGEETTAAETSPSVTPAPTPTNPSQAVSPTPVATAEPTPTKKPQATKAPTATPIPGYVTAMTNLSNDISGVIAASGLDSALTIERTETSIRIRLVASVIFEPGSDQLTAKARDLLQNVSAVITPYANLVTAMHTEGHTDSVTEIDADMSSKWDLASRRATRVLEMLLEYSSVSSSVSYTQGYGDQRPIADNGTEEGRDKNNRVDVVISSKP